MARTRLATLVLTIIVLTTSPALAHGGTPHDAGDRWFALASTIGVCAFAIGVVAWTMWRERRKRT